MKKLVRKLRELDDLELALLQDAIHEELLKRHPEQGFMAAKFQLRIVGNDDITDDDDGGKTSRSRSA